MKELPVGTRFAFHAALLFVGVAMFLAGTMELTPEAGRKILQMVGSVVGLIGLGGALIICWPERENSNVRRSP